MNTVKSALLTAVAALALGLGHVAAVHAEETLGEKAHEVGADTKKVAKKGYRKAKDATCEMVNGKMECVGQKVKHGAQNAADEVSDKADDVKKKVD